MDDAVGGYRLGGAGGRARAGPRSAPKLRACPRSGVAPASGASAVLLVGVPGGGEGDAARVVLRVEQPGEARGCGLLVEARLDPNDEQAS